MCSVHCICMIYVSLNQLLFLQKTSCTSEFLQITRGFIYEVLKSSGINFGVYPSKESIFFEHCRYLTEINVVIMGDLCPPLYRASLKISFLYILHFYYSEGVGICDKLDGHGHIQARATQIQLHVDVCTHICTRCGYMQACIWDN